MTCGFSAYSTNVCTCACVYACLRGKKRHAAKSQQHPLPQNACLHTPATHICLKSRTRTSQKQHVQPGNRKPCFCNTNARAQTIIPGSLRGHVHVCEMTCAQILAAHAFATHMCASSQTGTVTPDFVLLKHTCVCVTDHGLSSFATRDHNNAIHVSVYLHISY